MINQHLCYRIILEPPEKTMKITIKQVKLLHTVIFWILSICLLYSLFSGISGQITGWT